MLMHHKVSLLRRKLAAPVLDFDFAEAKRPILSKPNLLAVRAALVSGGPVAAGRLAAARAKQT